MTNAEVADEIIEEVRWLSDEEAVRKEWFEEKSPGDPGADAPEYFSHLFDDLRIENVMNMDAFSAEQKVLLLEFSRALEKAADHLYDKPRFVSDPYFRIAQKIAGLL